MGIILIALVLPAMGAAVAPVAAQSSLSAGMGVHFFQYDTTYLTVMNATYLHELTRGLELNIGGEFAIHTYDDEGSTEARFLIPANVGLNFSFPRHPATFVFGTGLTPVFAINPDDDRDFRFFMGPYAKAEVRLRVHPIMSWFVSAQQDLLVGGDDWISTGTRLATGINFSFEPYTP
ncbi:MAG: hypothetical protein EA427_04290 [Spirochaetaceae bacterium]|nr:MAG: hypothetical protein EA427_04290 [Spirochaetaceae bacterium]